MAKEKVKRRISDRLLITYCVTGTVTFCILTWMLAQRVSEPKSCVVQHVDNDQNEQKDTETSTSPDFEVTEEMRNRVLLLRRIKNQITEMWRATLHGLNGLKDDEDITDRVQETLKQLKLRHHSLMIDAEDLVAFDRPWQEKVAKETEKELITKIVDLQYPKNCDEAPQFYVPLTECGYGCAFRHLAGCLEQSMVNNLTLVAGFSNSIYSTDIKEGEFPIEETSSCPPPTNLKGWTEVLCQLTQCAPRNENLSRNITEHKKVFMKIEFIPTAVGFKPPGVTDEYWSRVASFHGNPKAWWTGQLLKYLQMPTEGMKNEINEALATRVDFTKPIVGVHVRRTDKIYLPGEDSEVHTLAEYMQHVADWYDKYEMRLEKENRVETVERRVFLATDDPEVWKETAGYPGYTFIGNRKFSETAVDLEKRETLEGLKQVIIDTALLSKCDFIVGTLSSSVTSAAYELRQAEHLDASDDVASLDYSYGAVDYPNRIQVAIYPHTANATTHEIELKIGDIIYTDTNLWNGYFRGRTRRTGEVGMYPTYKVKDSTVYYSDIDKEIMNIYRFDEAEDDDGNRFQQILKF
uniref:alpha-(1,6)-fucosyltransferase-like isoform X2 n=1 Tax=Ciona intestinalis TaxID=7719 RepID=UPI00089DB55C|nr:alpha-(1,6)-fucosyltransferase-like isoform X2 [Ciona intestinalis]|eukprot:XP_018671935.1 alpha-(1,6)-fucosyltransferase-like isoform X2 [Ciona intestinalis]